MSNQEKKTYHPHLVLLYRLAIVMMIYTICRFLFYLFNLDSFQHLTPARLGRIMLGGLKFDLSGVLYMNLLFLLLSLIPHPWQYTSVFQKIIAWVFYLFNAIGIALNCVDLIYYRFILRRTTASVFKLFESEENMGLLWIQFFKDYWYVFLICALLIGLMIFLYRRIKPRPLRTSSRLYYYLYSLVFLAIFAGLTVIGLRGGWRHSTRPINMSNAGKFVKHPHEMAIVLNTPFCIIRTIDKKAFTKKDFFSPKEVEQYYSPIIRPIPKDSFQQKNVVVFILESFSKEYIGGLNPTPVDLDYQGYTPFLDSLIGESLVFPNGFANGKKSIDAMPAVIASIPSLVLPYVSSEYSTNKVQSLANLLNEKGYETAFFHGAPNGSMGFESFAQIAGFDQYVGKTEFNDDAHFDGIWGIWDEPFFQFFAHRMNTMQQPFYTTVFSLSSHHPFKVPEQYEGVFPKGTINMHQVIGYTDYALKKFFETAKNQPWFDNTIFVITADHTNLPYYDSFKSTVATFAIPIIFYTPDGSLKGWDTRVAQQADIMPTVLGHLQYDKPYFSFGRNLLDSSGVNFAVNYKDEHYQMIVDSLVLLFDEHEPKALYNWQKDFGLQQNILDIQQHDSLILFTKAYLQQYNNRMIADSLWVE